MNTLHIHIEARNRVLAAQLRRLISCEPTLQVVECDRRDLVASVPPDSTRPSCIIIGLSVPVEDDLKFVRTLRANRPGVAIVALSTIDTDDYRCAAIAAGANCYIRPHELGTSLVPTLINLLQDFEVLQS